MLGVRCLGRMFPYVRYQQGHNKRFAGHSKWANIKHIKGLKDAQRAQTFHRLTRLMKVAIQEGGSANPMVNLQLQNAIDQAKRANMPVSSIEGVLKSSQVTKTAAKKYVLEIRGPGGCLVLVEIFTDNFAKCKQGLASILRKGSSAYADGGVKQQFEYKGIVDVTVPETITFRTETELLEVCTEHAIVSGAEDVQILHVSKEEEEEATVRFLCAASALRDVEKHLNAEYKYHILSSSSEYLPYNCINLPEADLATYQKLCDKLDAVPEITNVFDNIAYN